MSKKNNEFSIEEYTSIRAELIERIKIMNSQEASALVAIITSWAAGFTFANEILTKKFIMLDSFGTVVFQCLQTFIFLIPIFSLIVRGSYFFCMLKESSKQASITKSFEIKILLISSKLWSEEMFDTMPFGTQAPWMMLLSISFNLEYFW